MAQGDDREMVRWLKSLLSKRGDLSLDLSTTSKPGMMSHIGNPLPQEDRNKWFPGAHGPAGLAEMGSSRFTERSCLDK